jgi:hypothetical protein
VPEQFAKWIKSNAAIISVSVVLFVQIGSSIWWTAVLSQRVSDLERVVARNTILVDKIPTMEQQDGQIVKLLDKVAVALDRLNERLWQHQVETNQKK